MAIAELIALLYNRILPFCAEGAKWRFRSATWLVGMETLLTYELVWESMNLTVKYV